ncbi:hypothetical protein U1Q18_049345, partial [Sarracenia purpurea var. burkii]
MEADLSQPLGIVNDHMEVEDIKEVMASEGTQGIKWCAKSVSRGRAAWVECYYGTYPLASGATILWMSCAASLGLLCCMPCFMVWVGLGVPALGWAEASGGYTLVVCGVLVFSFWFGFPWPLGVLAVLEG